MRSDGRGSKTRYLLVTRDGNRSLNFPAGATVATGNDLEEMLETIARKAGVRITIERRQPQSPYADGGSD
jgi:hypothetical protein